MIPTQTKSLIQRAIGFKPKVPSTAIVGMDTTTSKVYRGLHPKQRDFLASSAKYRLYGGARGGGKSHAMRAEIVRQCLSYPGLRVIALRRTRPEIYQNMVDPMRKELPVKSYLFNGQQNNLRFMNGSNIHFGYCKNMSDVLQYQGIEFDLICIEEVTHWTEEEWTEVTTSLRSSSVGVRANFIGSTNPGSIGHEWVKRLWIDRDFLPEEDPSEFEFIPAKVYDNPTLLERSPEYIQRLESLPEKRRKIFLLGDWDVFEGQYFTEFSRDHHVISPFIPKRGVKRRIIALDYGFAAPSAVLWIALMTDGRIIVYRELYVTEHTYKKLALKIRALTTEEEKIHAVMADPSIVNKRSDTTASTGGQEMAKAGLKIIGADNDRIAGWDALRELLQLKEDPNSGEMLARLSITENCRNLIRTLPLQLHDERNPEDLDTKGEDHSVDALRYGIRALGVDPTNIDAMRKLNERLMGKKRLKTGKERERAARNKKNSPSVLGQKF